MRIAFAGTPEFAGVQLNALLQNGYEVVVVYTQPDKPAGRGRHLHISPVKEIAQAHHLAIEQPTTLKTAEAVETLEQYHPDIMIVSAFGMLLPLPFLQVPHYGCINVHASLLPRWRGASPIQQAILAGDAQSGITLMQMDVGLDTGDILAQKAYDLTPNETTGSLHNQLAIVGADLLIATLEDIFAGKITPQPQDASQVTHAHKILKEQGHLQWDNSAIVLDRQIRAFHPWPIAYSSIDSHILRIWEAYVVPLQTTATPGTIVEHHENGIVVATSQAGLLITHAQLPGKKMMPLSEIRKGHPTLFALGQKLL